MVTWFGHDDDALTRRLALPQVVAHPRLESTMDAAHALAADGAAAGTLVVSEEQTAGRGRGGKRWTSAPRAGIWATLIERPRAAAGIEVLSLRVGLGLARVLERWSSGPIQLKWPNDLFVGGRKLAGVLIEARWRDGRPEWVAIGCGINLTVPDECPEAAALIAGNPVEVVAACMPVLRGAAAAEGSLSDAELAEFASRDLALGRSVSAPAVGTARGITADGALLVESPAGVTPWRAGSLVLST